MAYHLCKCGHRKYKHKDEYGGYPIDVPGCNGLNLPRYDPNACRCIEYTPQSNLEYLESLLDKNNKGRKV